MKEGKLQSAVGDTLTTCKAYFANYDVEVDKRVFKALLPIHRKYVTATRTRNTQGDASTRVSGDEWVDALCAKRLCRSPAKLERPSANPGRRIVGSF
ncbi:MAG: hypothetical protein IPP83_00425 [Flavobacteriales bacterium]|nr:hypothetical protein [Flavobacteriales bacterium]